MNIISFITFTHKLFFNQQHQSNYFAMVISNYFAMVILHFAIVISNYFAMLIPNYFAIVMLYFLLFHLDIVNAQHFLRF